MKGQIVAAVVAGVALGYAGAVAQRGQPTALGQEKGHKPRWEYRVVLSPSEDKESAKKMTEQYNALAAEGWEYVGPVVDSTHARALNGPFSGVGGAYVVFKRPK